MLVRDDAYHAAINGALEQFEQKMAHQEPLGEDYLEHLIEYNSLVDNLGEMQFDYTNTHSEQFGSVNILFRIDN